MITATITHGLTIRTEKNRISKMLTNNNELRGGTANGARTRRTIFINFNKITLINGASQIPFTIEGPIKRRSIRSDRKENIDNYREVNVRGRAR